MLPREAKNFKASGTDRIITEHFPHIGITGTAAANTTVKIFIQAPAAGYIFSGPESTLRFDISTTGTNEEVAPDIRRIWDRVEIKVNGQVVEDNHHFGERVATEGRMLIENAERTGPMSLTQQLSETPSSTQANQSTAVRVAHKVHGWHGFLDHFIPFKRGDQFELIMRMADSDQYMFATGADHTMAISNIIFEAVWIKAPLLEKSISHIYYKSCEIFDSTIALNATNATINIPMSVQHLHGIAVKFRNQARTLASDCALATSTLWNTTTEYQFYLNGALFPPVPIECKAGSHGLVLKHHKHLFGKDAHKSTDSKYGEVFGTTYSNDTNSSGAMFCYSFAALDPEKVVTGKTVPNGQVSLRFQWKGAAGVATDVRFYVYKHNVFKFV